MTGLFVTGSGTDIGKTHVLRGLVAELRACGTTPRVMKPIVTGFDADAPAASDTGALLDALGAGLDDTSVARISPWRFAAALSPDRAAEREHRRIDFTELVGACRPRTAEELLLVEGIGGVMVPLDAEHTVLDWIAALGLPALLVTGTYLGSLSHALTAAVALDSREIDVAAVVVSESPDPALPIAEHQAVLERFLAPAPVVTWARGAARPSPPLLEALGSRLAA